MGISIYMRVYSYYTVIDYCKEKKLEFRILPHMTVDALVLRLGQNALNFILHASM